MKRVAYLLFFLVFLSCSSDEDTQIQKYEFEGEWNWTNTDGGFAFHIHETPKTTNKKVLLKLLADKTYAILINEETPKKGRYELTKEKSISSGNMAQYIKLLEVPKSPIVTTGIIKVDKDTLYISDNAYDGLGSKFVRVK